MPETVQHLLGQVVDGRFELRKLLGVSQNSAVFLTSTGDHDAAIKVIPDDPASSDAQLERWRAAASLSHPGLMGIFDFGRWVIDGSPCLYIVTELADEDLGQLLPHRSLTPDEARGMLAPVLQALDFLQEKGLVHGGLKPSNIHAIGDNVKLSADRILPAGESATAWPLAAPFAAPESVLFPAADLWALGVSLCQTLTQKLPERDRSGKWTVPELYPPFSKIVRAALVDDVTLRISLDSVRALLDPAFVPRRRPEAPARTAIAEGHDPSSPEALMEAVQPATVSQASAAAASGASSRTASAAVTGSASVAARPMPQIDPLSVPLSPVEPPNKAATKYAAPSRAPIPVSSLPQVSASVGGPRRVLPSMPVAERSNKLALVAGAAAIVLAILFVPRFLLRSTKAPAPPAQNVATSETARASAPPVVKTSPAAIPAAPGNTNPAPAKAEPANGKIGNAAGKSKPETASAVLATETSPAKPSAPGTVLPAAAADNPWAPIVVRKILPEVSEKARSTISGTVRINVQVQLNPDGTVSAAELSPPVVSQFFADLALKAARQWQFGAPASANTSAGPPTSAVIRFEFTQTGTAAYVL
jgi:TonB family protein